MRTVVPYLAQLAMESARRGDISHALTLAKQALATRPLDHGLMLFIGALHSRRSELDQAATYFREAARIAPSDPIAKLELTRVLIALNQIDEAEELLSASRLQGLEPKRLAAMIRVRRGDSSGAVPLYQQIVTSDPQDFESWGNLGVCRLSTGDPQGAIQALTSSLQLRRDQQRFREKWAEAEIAAGQGEQGLELCYAFAKDHPEDPLVWVTIARLHDLLGRPDEALDALEAALKLDPRHGPALVAIARLHERQNRIDELASIVERLEALDEQVFQLPLLKARLAFRRGDFASALQVAQELSEVGDDGACAELLGQIYDRQDKTQDAFEAFVEMNRDNGVAQEVIEARAAGFRSMLSRKAAIVNRPWVRSWRKTEQRDGQSDPVFLVGFPRSGTTLLDTLLMGHPGICVTEEKPMLSTVAARVGGYERLGSLDDDDLAELRALYFAECAKHVPNLEERILVDKQPFAMLEAPLIHRLFPRAKILFVVRHPCDVVLSCFITRFEPNAALANFISLEGTARLYDEMARFWSQCRSVMPLIVHQVRYERLVEDAESEMHALLAFLGLPWNDSVLDNRRTAQERGFISTPSYSQVVEPLYDRSIGRWNRYREQMRPVLPTLAPWAEQLSYDV